MTIRMIYILCPLNVTFNIMYIILKKINIFARFEVLRIMKIAVFCGVTIVSNFEDIYWRLLQGMSYQTTILQSSRP
jgi:hypothetical protein